MRRPIAQMINIRFIHSKKIHLVLKTCALVVGVLLVGLVPESKLYVETMTQGHSLREIGEYRAAITYYRTAHNLRPEAVTPQLWEARSQLLLGKPEETLSLFRRISAGRAADPGMLIDWGQAYYALGDDENAIVLWQRALQLGETEANYHLGIVALSHGSWSQAKTSLETSLTDRGNDYVQRAHYWLGILYASDDPVAAEGFLRAAVAGPGTTIADSARSLLRLLGQPLPPRQQRVTALGAALFGLGHCQVAQSYLERALAYDPNDVQAMIYLGATLEQQGENRLAGDYLEKALHLEPDNLLALYFKGKHLFLQREFTVARNVFVRLLTLDPQNAAACAEIGQTYAAEGKYGLAEKWFEAAAEQAPDQAEFYLILAEFESSTLLNLEKGAQAVQAAISSDPENPVAYDLLGWILYLSGQGPAAELALNRALRLEPDLTSAYYHLGKLYEKQNRLASARWAFGRAVDLGAGTKTQDLAEEALMILGEDTNRRAQNKAAG